MSGTYDLFVLQQRPIAADAGISTVHQTLLANGAELNDECIYVVELGDEADVDVEPVTDVAATLRAVASSPLLGLIEYDLDRVFVSNTYLTAAHDGSMDGLMLSIRQLAFEQQKPAFVQKVLKLGRALHETLGGARTVMDWGLTDRGFDWMNELRQARNGQRIGSYTMLDLPAS